MTREQDPKYELPLQPVTFHILLALAEGDRHGYAIIQQVLAATGGQLRIPAGSLYRSIQRMLERDLIAEVRTRPAVGEDDERRRYYRITLFGRLVAQAETHRLANLVRLARASGLVTSKG
ncbi:MAG TPA: helix-turn-helix transcriptional regulator [Polyangia bacterium]